MRGMRAWARNRWPAKDDLLLVDVVGHDQKLRRFLRKHSLEFGNVRRDGERVAFRAFVPARLQAELAEHASLTTLVMNASQESSRIHAAKLTSAPTNRFQAGVLPTGVGLAAAVPDPLEYWSADEIDTVIANLETGFPGVASRIELPYPTAEGGSTCWALRIGLGPPDTKDALVVLGGIHGAEWGSCECILNFATDVLTASAGNGAPLTYKGANSVAFTAAEVQSILQRMDLVLFPLVNRDGREYSRTTLSLWRKNRNHKDSGGVGYKIGVDLNRNFAFLSNFADAFDSGFFGSGVDDPSETNYCGTGPFSEPESLNVQHLLDGLPKARWLLDLHSPWQTVLYPWGDDDVQTDDSTMNFMSPQFDGMRGIRNDRPQPGDPGYREFMPQADIDEFKRLARNLASAMTGVNDRVHTELPFFAYGTFFGTSVDYAHARHYVDPTRPPIHALHVEWGDNQLPNPAWSAMEGKFMPEVVAGLVSFCVKA